MVTTVPLATIVPSGYNFQAGHNFPSLPPLVINCLLHGQKYWHFTSDHLLSSHFLSLLTFKFLNEYQLGNENSSFQCFLFFFFQREFPLILFSGRIRP